MLGRVTIYVDSEVITSFQDELEMWRNRIDFEITRPPKPVYEICDSPEQQVSPIKTIILKLQAQLLGTFPEPYICLFFYNYDNPTQKQMGLDVAMAQGQMKNIL